MRGGQDGAQHWGVGVCKALPSRCGGLLPPEVQNFTGSQIFSQRIGKKKKKAVKSGLSRLPLQQRKPFALKASPKAACAQQGCQSRGFVSLFQDPDQNSPKTELFSQTSACFYFPFRNMIELKLPAPPHGRTGGTERTELPPACCGESPAPSAPLGTIQHHPLAEAKATTGSDSLPTQRC